MKKIFETGAFYMLIALIFALAAIYQTVTTSQVVLAMLWFCAAAFALAAFLQLRKKRSG